VAASSCRAWAWLGLRWWRGVGGCRGRRRRQNEWRALGGCRTPPRVRRLPSAMPSGKGLGGQATSRGRNSSLRAGGGNRAREGRLPDLAAELVGLPVDVIVTVSPNPTLAASRATSTIPIVLATAGDPVMLGLASGLARPGGNVTGLSALAMTLGGKRLKLL